ncbi:MAG TPA: tripartite tricarboxylate transporter substrate binding protein [Xanthobacteraceae bacterium]|nr:tripartite tricarboxylate transporter substrate binding protein [Xanthobacteraceae bacterium]
MIREIHRLILRGLAAAVATALATVLAVQAPAQTFPERTVKLVVPVPPGGSTDAVARLVTLRMQAILGQPVIIENQPGGGGLIAARAVAAANPDGYTLLIGGIGTLAIGPSVKSPSFNAAAVFAPIGTVSTETMVLVVNPKVPADTLDAFVRYAKANGGKLNYGSAPGITPHFISELFKLKTGTDIVHIPYKGAGPVITDLLAGQIDMAFNNKSVLLQLVKQGRLRALAVTSAARWPELPEVPTLTEVAIFSYPIEVWWGIVGPAGLPRAIVARLNGAINEALQSTELRANFANLGIEARGGSPEDFASLLAEDAPRWFDIIRMTGIKLE